MSDSLLDSLRSGGARVSRGGFSIDRAKAREKLSKFQLVDPHHYVLEFVQAAYLLGATYVDFAIDGDSMRMNFDGEPFSREELENLYRASFSKADTPRLRALRHFAIGVSAAWGLDPARFSIDVDDGRSSLRVVLDRDGDDEFEELRSIGKQHTTVYLVEKLRLSHFVEHFRYLMGELSETVALREYCAHADIPVLVDNNSVSRGHKLHDRAQAVVPIDTPHETGRLGITLEEGLAQTHIQVLTNGVLAQEIRGSEEPFGFDVVLDSDRLSKGLSQSNVLHDDAWQHVRHAVIPEALYRSLATFVRDLDDVSAATHAQALRRAASWLWSLQAEQDTSEASASLKAARRAFRHAKIWPFAHCADDDFTRNAAIPLRSMAQIDTRFADRAVVTSSVALSDAGSGAVPTAILVEPAHRRTFEEHFGARLRDVTADIERAKARIERIDELARRGKPRMPDPEYFQAHRIVDNGTFRALLGVRTGDSRGLRGSIVKWNGQKLVLGTRDIGLDFANLMIWIRGPLVFQMDSPHFKVSQPYVDFARRVLMEIPTLAAEVIDRVSPLTAVGWLRTLTDFSALRRLARDLEFPIQHAEGLLEQAETNSGVTWHDLAQRSAPRDDADIADRVESLGPFAEVSVIEIGLERRVSLKELLEIYRREGRLQHAGYVSTQFAGPHAITGGDREIDLLTRVFGTLEDASQQTTDEMFRPLRSLPPEPPPATHEQSASRETPVDHPMRYELGGQADAQPATGPTNEDENPPFVRSIAHALEGAEARWTTRDVVVEQRPGSPAAVLEASACIINEAHPVISAAADDPGSTRHHRWALTAVWTALAAGGSRAVREFAFGQLADLLERA